MPLKDKKAQLEYNKQWKAKNKEKVREYQKIHQNTYIENKIITKYSPLVQKIQSYSVEEK